MVRSWGFLCSYSLAFPFYSNSTRYLVSQNLSKGPCLDMLFPYSKRLVFRFVEGGRHMQVQHLKTPRLSKSGRRIWSFISAALPHGWTLIATPLQQVLVLGLFCEDQTVVCLGLNVKKAAKSIERLGNPAASVPPQSLLCLPGYLLLTAQNGHTRQNLRGWYLLVSDCRSTSTKWTASSLHLWCTDMWDHWSFVHMQLSSRWQRSISDIADDMWSKPWPTKLLSQCSRFHRQPLPPRSSPGLATGSPLDGAPTRSKFTLVKVPAMSTWRQKPQKNRMVSLQTHGYHY